jgi:exodeoxyribonuclease VII large subunit
MKSQWEFGELFPAVETRRVWTVSELTQKVRRLVEQHVGEVWVTGEVSNLRAQTSGHIYFTLKDNGAQLSCVLFRNELVPNREYLQDGQKLNVFGDLTVYEARGQYQLLVRSVELQGTGALQVAFERLKQKLQAQGLFAAERKRALPRYPQRIGLVTSPTGAAIRDILHVIQRRHPGLQIMLSACRVQGDGAAHEIACAIRLLNEWKEKVDLILVARGGGSLEDLWAFNEEVVARAIFDSTIPIISAVGHEIDFTISDFVADVRAATPSAAAEIITEGMFASRRQIAESADYMKQLVLDRLDHDRDEVQALTERLQRLHPRRVVNERYQYLDELHSSLFRCLKSGQRHWKQALRSLTHRFGRARPSALLKQRGRTLRDLDRRIRELARHRSRDWKNSVASLSTRLRLLSPENVLARGYSITTDDSSGKIIRTAQEVEPGQKLKTRVSKGHFRSRVEK